VHENHKVDFGSSSTEGAKYYNIEELLAVSKKHLCMDGDEKDIAKKNSLEIMRIYSKVHYRKEIDEKIIDFFNSLYRR